MGLGVSGVQAFARGGLFSGLCGSLKMGVVFNLASIAGVARDLRARGSRRNRNRNRVLEDENSPSPVPGGHGLPRRAWLSVVRATCCPDHQTCSNANAATCAFNFYGARNGASCRDVLPNFTSLLRVAGGAADGRLADGADKHIALAGSERFRITYDSSFTWPDGDGRAKMYLPIPPDTGGQHITGFSSSIKGAVETDENGHRMIVATLHPGDRGGCIGMWR